MCYSGKCPYEDHLGDCTCPPSEDCICPEPEPDGHYDAEGRYVMGEAEEAYRAWLDGPETALEAQFDAISF